MRLLLPLCLLLSTASCACKDGYTNSTYKGQYVDVGSTTYRSCGMGCLTPNKDGSKKTCGCSKQCPCWDQHARSSDDAGGR